MSVVKINQYTSQKRHNDQASLLAKRAEILRKAQEQTLTIQETNDLFAQFNSTYESVSEPTLGTDGIDESWAVKLMKECEQEDGHSIKKQVRAKSYTRPALLEA